MRIALAGVAHETNTYCRDETRASDFAVHRGEAILRLAGSATNVGGMLEGCRAVAATPVPILTAWAQPSGVIAREAYDGLKAEILEGLEGAGALDAVALSLHGAGVVAGIDDLEADLCWAVRDLVGEGVPIVATFDLHGNVSQHMTDALDGLFGCHDYPHTDLYDRGLEAVRLIPRLAAGELRPVTAVETVPALLPPNTTLRGVAREVRDFCVSLELRPGVVDCTFFHGFPYTDTPLVGAHLTATADADRDLARATAREAARFLWERRERFRAESLSCKEAIERALTCEGSPVVINETSDNCGGGTPGDGTHLLRAMLEAGLENACFGFLVDPWGAHSAHEAGVGSTLELELGGRTDELHGPPLAVRAYVKSLSDGRFRWSRMLAGVPANLGPMARLRVDGIDVVVGSVRSQTFDPGVFQELGIDVRNYRIVALKSSQHFRAGFEDLAAEIVTADPPGLTTLRVEIFERRRKPGPLWPVDAEARY